MKKIILYLVVICLLGASYSSNAQSLTKNYLINSITSKIVTLERMRELASGIYSSIDERYYKIPVKEFEENYFYNISTSVSQNIKEYLQICDLENLKIIEEISNLWYSNYSRYRAKMQIEANRIMDEEMKRTGQPVEVRTYAKLSIDEKNLLSDIKLLKIMGYGVNVEEIINSIGEKVILSELILNLTENGYSKEQIDNELKNVQYKNDVDKALDESRKSSNTWYPVFFNSSLLIADQFKENEITLFTSIYLGKYGEELQKLNYVIFSKTFSIIVEKIVK